MNVISAYMLINKAIPSSGGPYKVRFYDDGGNLIQTDANVPQGGRASCTLLDGSILNGQYFKGWNPAPNNVTADMDCFPVRGDYYVSIEEIHDSWETICADAGAHYPLGAYKSLNILIPRGVDNEFELEYAGNSHRFYLDDDNYAVVEMMKVAEGEDGSTSTWLSRSVFPAYGTNWGVLDRTNWTYLTQIEFGNYNGIDWGCSPWRQYLNSVIIANLPECLQMTIKEVNKDSMGWSKNQDVGGYEAPAKIYKTTLDKIWIPSVGELKTLADTCTWNCGDGGTTVYKALDYSTIMPDISWISQTRDICNQGGSGGAGRGFKTINAQNDVIIKDTYMDKTVVGFCL